MTVSQVGWVKQCDNRNHGLSLPDFFKSPSFWDAPQPYIVLSEKFLKWFSLLCKNLPNWFTMPRNLWTFLTFLGIGRHLLGRLDFGWIWVDLSTIWPKILTCFWKMRFSLLSVRSAASKRCRTFESTIIVPGLAHNTRTLSVLHTTCRSGGSCWLRTLVEGVPFSILSWDVKDSVCLYFYFILRLLLSRSLGSGWCQSWCSHQCGCSSGRLK